MSTSKAEAAFAHVATQLGAFTLVATPQGVLILTFGKKARAVLAEQAAARLCVEPTWDTPRAVKMARLAETELKSYAHGKLQRFTVPVDASGTPPFHRRVHAALARIPFGGSTSYGALARAVGSPGGARAVGGAMRSNAVPIIVPCHRVLASDGGLGGYSGGLDVKRRLLRLEGVSV